MDFIYFLNNLAKKKVIYEYEQKANLEHKPILSVVFHTSYHKAQVVEII